MPTNNTKSILYQHIVRLREQLHVTLASYPLQLSELCAQQPIQITRHSFQTAGFCALAFIGEKFDTIVLNTNRNQVEQNFDCGHELIHLSKHRNLKMDSFNCFDKTQPTQNPFIEWEANEGAAELLVPFQLFLPALCETSRNYCREPQRTVPALAKQFSVTTAVIECRIRSLQYELYQYAVLGTDLSQIALYSRHESKRRHLSHLTAFSHYCPSCLHPLETRLFSICPHCGTDLQKKTPLFGLGYHGLKQPATANS